MNIKNMTKDELELLSYNDIAILILKDEQKPLTTAVLFKKICQLLELSDAEYETKIADFFANLTTDKHFILLDEGAWDLRTNHVSKVIIEDDDDTEDLEVETDDDETIDDNSVEDLENNDAIDDDYDDEDDDLDELVIVDESELE